MKRKLGVMPCTPFGTSLKVSEYTNNLVKYSTFRFLSHVYLLSVLLIESFEKVIAGQVFGVGCKVGGWSNYVSLVPLSL